MAKRLIPSLVAVVLLAVPAVAQEREWTLDASGEDAYLVFGVPESDDVGVSLWCPVQQGTVNIFVPGAPAAAATQTEMAMTIRTDDQSAEVKGQVETDSDTGTTSVEATLPADHPIFASMLKSDRFRISLAGEETVFPLFDADLAGLMDLCRKP